MHIDEVTAGMSNNSSSGSFDRGRQPRRHKLTLTVPNPLHKQFFPPFSLITCSTSPSVPDIQGPNTSSPKKFPSSITTTSATKFQQSAIPPLDQPHESKMAPKRIQIQTADHPRRAPKGYFSNVYSTLTSPENASVVRSVAVFGVRSL